MYRAEMLQTIYLGVKDAVDGVLQENQRLRGALEDSDRIMAKCFTAFEGDALFPAAQLSEQRVRNQAALEGKK